MGVSVTKQVVPIGSSTTKQAASTYQIRTTASFELLAPIGHLANDETNAINNGDELETLWSLNRDIFPMLKRLLGIHPPLAIAPEIA